MPAPGREALPDGPALAGPGRRLLAAATDVAILLAAQLVLLALLFAADADERALALTAPAGLVGGWLYLWIGWGWFGATPGKALWRLRVVPVAGGAMTPGRGLARCAGYFLACMPARLGLLAMLWDPRRQGWHDRLTGTVVVHCDLPRRPWPRRRRPRALARPRWRRALAPGPLTLAVLGYGAAALLLTWPLAAHLTTHRAGTPGDGDLFVWGLWHLDRAVRLGLSPTSSDLIYHPVGATLLTHTVNWLAAAASLPLQRLFGLAAAYNLVVLGSLVLSATALYLLAASLVRDRLACWIGGLAGGLSPYFLIHSVAHLNLVTAAFVTLHGAALYTAAVGGGTAAALAAGLFLALCGYVDWYYFLAALVLALTLTGAVAAQGAARQDRDSVRRALRALAVALGVAGVLVAPLLIATLRQDVGAMGAAMADREAWSIDLIDILRPSLLHPWWGSEPTPRGSEWVVTPGATLLWLALVGCRTGERRLRPWIVAAVAGLLLALGPRLAIGAPVQVPSLLALAVGGPPGAGLEPPWTAQPLAHTAGVLAAQPASVVDSRSLVPLPFNWLPNVFPMLRPVKVPARFAMLALLAVGLLAAHGVAHLRRRLPPGPALALAAALVALVLVEYLAVPYPLRSMEPHPFHRLLAARPDIEAVVDVPVCGGVPIYQLAQTVHGKRLFSGQLARTPPAALAYLERNELLGVLSSPALPFRPAGTAELVLDDGRPPRAALAAALASLRDHGAGYLLVHKRLLRPTSVARAHALLAGELGLPVVLDDAELRVYDLRTGFDSGTAAW